jgi:hypothetical protein
MMDLALEHLDVEHLDAVEAPLGTLATIGIALGALVVGGGIGFLVAAAVIT